MKKIIFLIACILGFLTLLKAQYPEARADIQIFSDSIYLNIYMDSHDSLQIGCDSFMIFTGNSDFFSNAANIYLPLEKHLDSLGSIESASVKFPMNLGGNILTKAYVGSYIFTARFILDSNNKITYSNLSYPEVETTVLISYMTNGKTMVRNENYFKINMSPDNQVFTIESNFVDSAGNIFQAPIEQNSSGYLHFTDGSTFTIGGFESFTYDSINHSGIGKQIVQNNFYIQGKSIDYMVLGEVRHSTFYCGGMDSSKVFKFGILTKIEDEQTNKMIKIFPNPAKDFIVILLNENSKIEEVSIFDITGKIISKDNLVDAQINIEQLEQGIYFLRVIEKDGHILIGKFVKE